jgi:hypothetical protein
MEGINLSLFVHDMILYIEKQTPPKELINEYNKLTVYEINTQK